ncbi:hypothetical protein ACM66B_004254 [Microbotryomycetes sp. NB124-2]
MHLFTVLAAGTLLTTALALPHQPELVERSALRIGSDLVERQTKTCKVNADCASLPAMWAARPACKNGVCGYTCNSGYTMSPWTGKCVKNAGSSTTSRTSTTSRSTTSSRPTTTSRSTTTTRPTTTTTRATTTTSSSSSSGSGATPDALNQAALARHNTFRAKHGARPLVYDPVLAQAAQTWANKCKWEHSRGAVGPYGENLAATSGYESSIIDGIAGWEAEAPDYNPANPMYSHFTQMVWKYVDRSGQPYATKLGLGCAMARCPTGSIFNPSYGKEIIYVCEYSPPGNSGGPDDYRANVQP